MARPAREKIALLLQGGEAAGSFSVETSAPVADVTLTVAGVGPVRLPVGAAQERMLVSAARPAMFGLGEQTLTDTSVRDTWELTADQISLGGQWEQLLEAALVEVQEGLGLPRAARLRAELHALLVYGPDQFFAPHRDSEKDDAMVATLVVSLPSVHTGGELAVTHGDQTRMYRHRSRDEIGFVAFYADCLHEVRPVRSGRRVTLTFNLLVSDDPEAPELTADDELAGLISEHFATSVTRPWSTASSTPNRLVVLLDHQYSERGLMADRHKGRDAEWVSRLRSAADRAGCTTALALAEIRQTWSAYEGSDSWHYRYDEDEDQNEEEDRNEEEGDESYDVGELIEDEISLGWWKRSQTGTGEQISLRVDESEVCTVTPTSSLAPYESAYEGYMGNYGNTLDRWYRRAAIVVWPTERDFVARAEANLPGAIAELAARLDAGEDLDRARTDARGLVGLVGVGSTSVLASLLPVVHGLDDAELSLALLAPLKGEWLTVGCAAALADVAQRYGDSWTQSLVESWFAVGGYRYAPWEWVTGVLPDLALALDQAGADEVVPHLCRRIWASLSMSIKAAVTSGPRARAASLTALVPASEAILTVAGTPVTEDIVATLSTYDDGVLDLELPLLRRLGAGAPRSLADDAVRRLEGLLAAPVRSADDWTIVWSGCGCELCDTLQGFLADRGATGYDWPLRTDRRQHIHQRIEAAELPVSHRTIRKGSPYTLRLTKERDLHVRKAELRRRAKADLAWLRQDG